MQNSDAVADALREVLKLVEGADAQEMVSRRPKRAEAEVVPEGEEHEAEEMALLRELEDMHPDEKEEGY